MINYFADLNRDLHFFETHRIKFADTNKLFKLCDRIEWCWKFKKITENELSELTDRVCEVLKKEAIE